MYPPLTLKAFVGKQGDTRSYQGFPLSHTLKVCTEIPSDPVDVPPAEMPLLLIVVAGGQFTLVRRDG